MTAHTSHGARLRVRILGFTAFLAAALAVATVSRAATITLAGDRGSSCVTLVGTTGGTHPITVAGATVPSGQTLVLTAGTTGNASLSGITDTGGGTWSAVNSPAAGGVGRVFHWASTVGTALNVGDTVTLTYVTSTDGEISCASIHAFTNVQALPGGVDLAASASGTSTTPSVTLGSPTAQANELLVETHIINGAPGGTSSADLPLQQANSGTFFVLPYYRIVSATGTFTVGGTLGNSLPWQAVLTTFKDVTVPVELQKLRVE